MRSALAITLVGLLVACGRKDEATPERLGKTHERPSLAMEEREHGSATSETIVSGARIDSAEFVADRIADVRCTRESTCQNIGEGRRYDHRDTCMAELRRSSLEELRAEDCPRGTDPRRLDDCLSEIRGQACTNRVERLDRLTACRRSNMCFRSDAP